MLGSNVLPVPNHFMWYFSNFHDWQDTKPDALSKPEYGVSCSMANPLSGYKNWMQRGWEVGAYRDARVLERNVARCTRALHESGFASFYGCYNVEVGFGDPEDSDTYLDAQPARLLAPGVAIFHDEQGEENEQEVQG